MKNLNWYLIKSIFVEAFAGGLFWSYGHHVTGGIFFALCAATFVYAILKKIIQ